MSIDSQGFIPSTELYGDTQFLCSNQHCLRILFCLTTKLEL
jgi:hypothetical protein